MSLETRLKKLTIDYDVPLFNVINIYTRRYKYLKEAYGKEYSNRESHIIFKAYKGTEIEVKDDKKS